MERWTEKDFEGSRSRHPGLWVVAFLADWCPFCRAFRPEFAAMEGRHPFPMAVIDLTDLESPLWETFAVEVVPTVAVFADGRLVWRRDGIAMQGLGRRDLQDLAAAARAAGGH
ncbi:MAG: thioredoxin family protein [Thermoplasmata archaeon]